MNVRDYRSEQLMGMLSQRIAEARQFASEEYHAYYEMLSELVVLIVKYHENELNIKGCKDEEDQLSKDVQRRLVDVNDDTFTDMWTELAAKTKRCENNRMVIEKEFSDLLYDFNSMDRELFNDNLSS